MSMEYVFGRLMQTNLLSMDLEKNYKKALSEIGYDLVSDSLIRLTILIRTSYMKKKQMQISGMVSQEGYLHAVLILQQH